MSIDTASNHSDCSCAWKTKFQADHMTRLIDPYIVSNRNSFYTHNKIKISFANQS